VAPPERQFQAVGAVPIYDARGGIPLLVAPIARAA
jgi:hypothetical protein